MRLARQLHSAVVARMAAKKSYEEAVQALNTLQSNAAVLEKIKKEKDEKKHLNLPETISFARRVGIELDDLDNLSIIHVSGTKGKGSTCAYCESILRMYGYKTGFFSSPHLVEVRERIRINGKPISKELFSNYFWHCFNSLEDTKGEHGGMMPAYFKFLTVMALHVFLQEQVDVAILEVGIGGSYCSTNIIRSPVVCGISSLGLDHTNILGDTVEKIAWHKAGIIKPGVPVVTVPQPGNSLQVILEQAEKNKSPLYLAPVLTDYDWNGHQVELGIAGEMQARNASLALQLSNIWMKSHKKEREAKISVENGLKEADGKRGIQKGAALVITDSLAEGLRRCRWPGRNQILDTQGVRFFIDGAHTPRSMEQCVHWYSEVCKKFTSDVSPKPLQVLLFNTTGARDPKALLSYLKPLGIDIGVFCPNIVFPSASCAGDQASKDPRLSSPDLENKTVTQESQHTRCIKNKDAWTELETTAQNDITNSCVRPLILKTMQNSPSAIPKGLLESLNTGSPAVAFPTIQEALDWIIKLAASQRQTDAAAGDAGTTREVNVLCTGSLHLVGGILRVLDPDICDR